MHVACWSKNPTEALRFDRIYQFYSFLLAKRHKILCT